MSSQNPIGNDLNLSIKTTAQTGAEWPYDLSIVVVSYNTIEMTRECLTSIARNACGLKIQTIVVDNNSQDNSASMVRSDFDEVVLIQNSENKGFAAANNQAFALCRSPYILLLNSDTVVLDSVLKSSTDYLERHPEVGAMGCQVLNPDRTIQRTCSGYPTLMRLLIMTLALDKISWFSCWDHYLMRAWPRDEEREVEVISGCYLLVRQEILKTIGVLDQQFFFFGEETDWCKRIREAGWKLAFAPVGQIIHYGGGSVKQLNYKRDVMLTAATVRLHRKHGGLVAAMIAYCILMLFNFSRAVAWTLAAFIKPSASARAKHFFQIVQSFQSCWPDETT